MMSDRKRWAMVRKELYSSVKKAKTLDELISLMKRWHNELTGGDMQIAETPKINSQSSVSTFAMPSSNNNFEAPETFERETLDQNIKMIICPHCGEKIEFTQGTVFCPNCGIPID